MDGVKNYNIAVKKRGEDITFLRRIVRGPADDSYGIEVAKLAGLPDSVTQRAPRRCCKPAGRPLRRQADKRARSWTSATGPMHQSARGTQRAGGQAASALDVETLTPIEALNFLYTKLIARPWPPPKSKGTGIR